MKKSTSSVEFYDLEAQTVERYASTKFWDRRYHNKRREIVQQLMTGRILRDCSSFADIGCGTGEYLLFSKKYVKHVYGLDLSVQYLRRSKLRKPDGLVSGSALDLPFRSLAFDGVLCSEVIEHVQDQEKLIGEVLRVARKFALFSTPNQGLIRTFFSIFAKSLVQRTDSKFGHLRILKFGNLKEKLIQEQWQVVFAFTRQILPPALDDIRLPSTVSPAVQFFELGSDILFQDWGSTSFVLLERERPS